MLTFCKINDQFKTIHNISVKTLPLFLSFFHSFFFFLIITSIKRNQLDSVHSNRVKTTIFCKNEKNYLKPLAETSSSTKTSGEFCTGQHKNASHVQVRNPMVHSFPSEANSCSASQEISRIFSTRLFIAVFTKSHHLSPLRATLKEFLPSNPISLKSVSILPSHLRTGLPVGLLPSDLPPTAQ